MLKDKNFIKWLEKNEIIYDENDNDLIKALYGEYMIERENKVIDNIFYNSNNDSKE